MRPRGPRDPGRGRAARLRAAPGRRADRAAGWPVSTGAESTRFRIQRLRYQDLPQVIAIERRAFPAPWSLAMFVLELSKTAGVCLGAWRSEEALAGYCICSRYDTIWHIMNISVDPVLHRRGVATAMLDDLFTRLPDPEAQFTLEVRQSNLPAIALYERYGFLIAGVRKRYYQDNGEDAYIMWRTAATLEGRLDDVPNAGPVQPTPGTVPPPGGRR
ncbi:ribosomal-protein-alanine N-acetyltransferase [Conexibacter sp. W3-3-2]|nr:ribosomal-protein-alanine N-acetyltransferase [Conexibacter sp. W3-3-2]